MMKQLIVLSLAWLILFCFSESFAAEEILYNTISQKSVLDLKTDPNLKPWESNTPLNDLCFKNATPEVALEEILKYEKEQLLFDFDTESYVESYVEDSGVVIFALNGKMMDDGLNEEATEEYFITPCKF